MKKATGNWPPRCEAPDCVEPRDGGPAITVDFGTYTASLMVCAYHRERWSQ